MDNGLHTRVFSSPEPKAVVGFSDRNLSVVVNFSHLHLLQKHTWCSGDVISKFVQKRTLSRSDDRNKSEIKDHIGPPAAELQRNKSEIKDHIGPPAAELQRNKSEIKDHIGPPAAELQKQGIYQLFYKEKSSADKGSLYQLRNLINRRNVSGPEEVNSSYRAHHDFITDITDSYIVAAFLDLMQMEDLSCTPNPIPLFSLMSDNQKYEWLLNAAERVLNELKVSKVSFQDIVDDMGALDGDVNNLDAMKSADFFLCAVCGKQYHKRGWLKKHLEKKHHWKFHIPKGNCVLQSHTDFSIHVFATQRHLRLVSIG
ncbi:uncharacterized protein LOC125657560 [Ostrea edulis]|uniref:uncharacterized protein LOC125657560 n=1 Tax=Ostrea edulis TaxID=37623 RepID=UPI0024AF2D17|nr:uncharacterized protein LOC125657560 [Ostrea edulis]